jgi:hypothetical protein
LLDKNYLSEPTFDYKIEFISEYTKDTPRLKATVDSIRRACDRPQYKLTIKNENRVEGSLSCTFKSRIEIYKTDSIECIRGIFATKVIFEFNLVQI